MKVRNGFVSNSSSSSFIVITTLIKNLTPEIILDDRFRVIGDYYSDGNDLFKPDKETKEVFIKNINEYKHIFNGFSGLFGYYLVDRYINEEGTIVAEDVDKNVEYIEVDYCASVDEELPYHIFLERYAR